MTDRPKEGQRRIRSGVVAQAVVPGGKPVFFVEAWHAGCPCPDCMVDGHWTRIGNSLGYATWIEANMVADPPQITMGSGGAALLDRVAKLESGAGIAATEANNG